jgi:hypothetical protein
MYARLVRFAFGPGKRAEAQAVADDLGPLIASQPGCEGVTVFGDDNSRFSRFDCCRCSARDRIAMPTC